MNRRRLLRFNKKTEKKIEKNKIDKSLFILTIVLTILGLLAVADASSPQALSEFHDPYHYFKQQIMWAGVGFAALIFGAIVNYKVWEKIAGYMFTGTIILLILVLIPGLGLKVLGARRWLYFGPIGFQPSEIVKLTLSMMGAKLFSDKKHYFYPAAMLGFVAFLVMLQPDFGTTLVILAVGAVQIFVAGIPWLVFLGLSGLVVISGILVVLTSDYRRQRLMTFLQISADPLGSSYHITQVLIAMGSGGLFGVGLGKSRQKHLFLPETATDSVFAVIAEETGFIGASLVVIMLFYFIIRMFKISLNAPDDFSKILGTGISTWIGVQTFLNLTSMVALTPLTGIPLPFFSYGGSSLTMILFSVGILLNISKYKSST